MILFFYNSYAIVLPMLIYKTININPKLLRNKIVINLTEKNIVNLQGELQQCELYLWSYNTKFIVVGVATMIVATTKLQQYELQ